MWYFDVANSSSTTFAAFGRRDSCLEAAQKRNIVRNSIRFGYVDLQQRWHLLNNLEISGSYTTRYAKSKGRASKQGQVERRT